MDPTTGRRICRLQIERLNSDEAKASINGEPAIPAPVRHADAIDEWLPRLLTANLEGAELTCVGHRIVHGGQRFTQPTLINDAVMTELQSTISLAPLHNPPSFDGIASARSLLPNLPHVAVV